MRVNIFRQDGDRRNALIVFDFLAVSNLLSDLHALLANLVPLLRNGGVQRAVLDAEQNLGAVVDANAVEIIFDAVIADEGSGADTDIAVKGNNGVQFGIRNVERGELIGGTNSIVPEALNLSGELISFRPYWPAIRPAVFAGTPYSTIFISVRLWKKARPAC
mgnify:CR=1 FL=1